MNITPKSFNDNTSLKHSHTSIPIFNEFSNLLQDDTIDEYANVLENNETTPNFLLTT